MCWNCKVANISNAEQSGIVEVVSQTDQLLHDLIHEQMERDLQRKENTKVLDAREEAQVVTEKVVREAALSCIKTRTTKVDDDVASSSTNSRKRCVDSGDIGK